MIAVILFLIKLFMGKRLGNVKVFCTIPPTKVFELYNSIKSTNWLAVVNSNITEPSLPQQLGRMWIFSSHVAGEGGAQYHVVPHPPH